MAGTKPTQATTFELEKYTAAAKGLVAGAQKLADDRSHEEVEALHLLARAIDSVPGVADVMRRAGADPADVLAAAEHAFGRMPRHPGGVAYLSGSLQELLHRAERDAEREKSATVDVEHLVNALSQELRGRTGELLQSFNLGPGCFRPYVEVLRTAASQPIASETKPAGTDAAQAYVRDLVAQAKGGDVDPVIGRDAEVRRVLQILERRGKNHPLLVGEPGVGKTAVIRALARRFAAGDVPSNIARLRILELDTGALVAGAKLRGELEERVKRLADRLGADKSQHDAVLVVENFDTLFGQGALGAGVGDLLKPMLAKGEIRLLATTTPEGMRKIQERDPSLLRRVTVVTIDPPTIAQAIEMLRGVSSRYERHHAVRIGEAAVLASVTLAKRYLQDRELPDSAIDLLDETAARKRVELEGVPAELDSMIRRLASLKAQEASLANDPEDASLATRGRLAQERAQLEPKVAETRSAMESRRGATAAAQSLRKELDAATAALEVAREKKDFARLGELEHVTLPELNRRVQAADAAVQRVGGLKASNVVTDQDVATTLGEWTGIPVAKMLEAETEKLTRMEERLGMRVVGQNDALRALSQAVRRGRVGLRDPGKPIGSFLFLGPSGVGKTELAKALAEFLFDDEAAMTRLDMSEFMERHMAQRLVGAPPGYADSEQGGFLTEAVRQRPYSVLLFDEVEKAHADVFNLLLQVLDDGRLTDGRGRTADFSNTVVIMTSNLGAKRILESEEGAFETDDGRDALRDMLMQELRTFFRPEFLNRIDDVIVFRALTKPNLRGIVDIQLRKVDELLREREVSVVLTDDAKDRLVELGYEPAFGARPVRRAIVREVQNPLAELLLKGTFRKGDVVQVAVEQGRFEFRRAP